MLVYDLADPAELQGFVRAIQQEQDENRFVLNQFLPNQNLDDIEYRVRQGQLRDQDAAMFRAWDAESPIGGRQGVSRMMGELPPLSEKIRLGEEERLRLRALERGDNAAIINAIYDDAANMARAVAARIEMARGEALVTGGIHIDENGVDQTVDFGRDASMEPASPSTLWDDPGATVIEDMTGWVEDYVDINGVRPAVTLVSTAIAGNLLRNDQIRTLAGSLAGTPDLVSRATVGNVFGAFELPPLAVYDVSTRVAGTSTRVIPSDRLLLLPPAGEPIGATFFGTTAEALELVGARQISADAAPGLTAVVEKTFDPVATWTKAAAISLPVLINPNLVLVVTVL